ncbi:hypothetical protein KM043_013905 [Ampulex compressa]|nr:hypothetical protein KM043_013905 [Ampulex compressa]
MFGGLNETVMSSLKNMMKQAEKDEDVRKLVLLLVGQCQRNEKNESTKAERDKVLGELLRMPVHKFSSKESREAIDRLDKLGTLWALSSSRPKTTKFTTSSPASATTYRGELGRKLKTSTESTIEFLNKSGRYGKKDNLENERSITDKRAVELLSSLYAVTTK